MAQTWSKRWDIATEIEWVTVFGGDGEILESRALSGEESAMVTDRLMDELFRVADEPGASPDYLGVMREALGE